MKLISAIGSFKGTISSVKINNTAKEIFEKHGFKVDAIPLADGGDGLLDSLCLTLNAAVREIDTVNALGEPIKARVGISGNIAIVESALATGLAILKKEQYNPLKASSYGTGVLIKQLAEEGIGSIILGLGGSATNDGGIGCLAALGFEFFNSKNEPLAPAGENLINISRIDSRKVSERVKNLKLTIACDVTNPLLNETGATYVYGRQKGADDAMLLFLENGMKNYARIVSDFCKKDFSNEQGAGAAGGMGFGLISFLNAEMKKGAELVLEYSDYENKLKDADLVITGEGQLDSQTEFGKLPQIAAKNALNANVKCIAVAGSCTANKESLKRTGIDSVFELINYESLEKCMTDTENVVRTVFEDIAIKISNNEI